MAQAKFQRLLRALFQFDRADLDFGIYRIMNYKRDVIERFILEGLPRVVADELNRDALGRESKAAAELAGTAAQITAALGTDALDAGGNLAGAYHTTPLGKKYLELKSESAGYRGRAALETAIYNHLYAFFSRYYQDGDFISKRRYSKREKYAIPYNGEEVYLYWANHDQFYVKTAEHFRNYSFETRGVTVHFKLTSADIEKDNVKGDRRFFLPCIHDIIWNEDAHELFIPFEYRPLTDREITTYGTRNQQDKIIIEAVGAIPKKLKKADDALFAVTAERHRNSEGRPVTFLEHHLRQYTRKNTSDFFIHKDLKGFLTRELDFYLKNEVLNLEAVVAAGEGFAGGWFQTMRVIRAVGCQIIDFLDQIESFQKMLWEKRKFVTETEYCIAVNALSESFYADIAACEAQWAEWKELLHIDEEHGGLFPTGKNKMECRIAFLKAHPALMIDTAHFPPDFVDRLLSTIDNLDASTDCLLINGDNYQGLRLLAETYREQVQCVYIDPPYNTDASPILYKNGYKSSTWMSMMEDRLRAALYLMAPDAVHVTAIDDEQHRELSFLISRVFRDRYLGTICVRANPSGRPKQTGYAVSHEYLIFSGKGSRSFIGRMRPTEAQMARFSEQDGDGVFEWRNLRREGSNSDRAARRALYYPIYIDSDQIRIPKMKWDEEDEDWQVLEKPKKGELVVWPINERGDQKTWRWEWQTVLDSMGILAVRPDRSGRPYVYYKRRPHEDGVVSVSCWFDAKYSATEHGTAVIKSLFGRSAFSYPKSVFAVADAIYVAGASNRDVTVLDYFAGSGTTVHATINLNRLDAGRRKCIAIEVEGYFDTVLMPRIKKVVFTPEWKDGKPVRVATGEEAARGPRIIKYIRLESYEDTLNNIAFDDGSGQAVFEFDDYLLKYMLKWETRKSQTLLNINGLSNPFSYKLTVARGDETVEKVVDLPETFNYLMGIHVNKRMVYYDDEKKYLVYRGHINHRRVTVIWRETNGWRRKDLERDKEFVTARGMTKGADAIFVNGDSFIPNARALEPLFKARMFATVEV